MTNKVISKDKYVVTKVLRDIPLKIRWEERFIRLDRMTFTK